MAKELLNGEVVVRDADNNGVIPVLQANSDGLAGKGLDTGRTVVRDTETGGIIPVVEVQGAGGGGTTPIVTADSDTIKHTGNGTAGSPLMSEITDEVARVYKLTETVKLSAIQVGDNLAGKTLVFDTSLDTTGIVAYVNFGNARLILDASELPEGTFGIETSTGLNIIAYGSTWNVTSLTLPADLQEVTSITNANNPIFESTTYEETVNVDPEYNYNSIEALKESTANFETITNKVPISSGSTAEQYPTAKSVWDLVQDVAATIPSGGLKIPISIDLESNLPDVTTLQPGDYYYIQNMDVTAAERTGKAWVNYTDPEDVSTPLRYYMVIDQYQSMDGISITQTGGGAWEVNQEWLKGAIDVATVTSNGLMAAGDRVTLNNLNRGFIIGLSAIQNSSSAVTLRSTYSNPTLGNSVGVDTVLNAATTTTAGVLTAEDKTKLDGLIGVPSNGNTNQFLIFTGGAPYWMPPMTQAMLNAGTESTARTISASLLKANFATKDVATQTIDGLMSAADKAKLDSLPTATTIALTSSILRQVFQKTTNATQINIATNTTYSGITMLAPFAGDAEIQFDTTFVSNAATLALLANLLDLVIPVTVEPFYQNSAGTTVSAGKAEFTIQRNGKNQTRSTRVYATDIKEGGTITVRITAGTFPTLGGTASLSIPAGTISLLSIRG